MYHRNTMKKIWKGNIRINKNNVNGTDAWWTIICDIWKHNNIFNFFNGTIKQLLIINFCNIFKLYILPTFRNFIVLHFIICELKNVDMSCLLYIVHLYITIFYMNYYYNVVYTQIINNFKRHNSMLIYW